MGKTFVEDERPCDQCVNRTRYGCASWDCKFIDRDEAIKAWKEKHEMADRKTENSSEKPNNSTSSKMEQVDKDINVRSKTEPQVVMPKKCKGCDSASKIIEAYSKGFKDGAEAAKAMPQTDCAWKEPK